MSDIQLCSRCVLPSTFPGVQFRDGICNFCAQSPVEEDLKARKAELAAAMRRIIDERRGSAGYDCVVAFSGGKDSTYTLMMLVEEFDLKCLAVMVDNGFISERAIANGKAATSALGVDLVTYTPSFAFMKDMYVESIRSEDLHPRSAVRRASSVCNSCINLINNYMLKTATQHGIPMIAGGYVGGQVPKDAAVLRVDLGRKRKQHEMMMERRIAALGPAAARHFDLGPTLPGGIAELVIINPMLIVTISEEEIIDAIGPLGWERTVDTGMNSSNCRLNDLGVSLHYRKHRFHPYVFEISEQIRAGVLTREAGLRKVQDIPSLSNLTGQLEKLELNAAGL